jgi:hypothetical protein
MHMHMHTHTQLVVVVEEGAALREGLASTSLRVVVVMVVEGTIDRVLALPLLLLLLLVVVVVVEEEKGALGGLSVLSALSLCVLVLLLGLLGLNLRVSTVSLRACFLFLEVLVVVVVVVDGAALQELIPLASWGLVVVVAEEGIITIDRHLNLAPLPVLPRERESR